MPPATSGDEQKAMLDSLLKAWSDTSPMVTTATGAYAGHALTVTFQNITPGSAEHQAWLDKLTILERFNGQTFRDVPTGTGAVSLNFVTQQMSLLDQSYAALKDSVYQGLVLQTRLRAVFDALTVELDASGLVFDFASSEQLLGERVSANARSGIQDMLDFHRGIKPMIEGQSGGYLKFVTDTLHAQGDLSAFSDLLAEHKILIGAGGAAVSLSGGTGEISFWAVSWAIPLLEIVGRMCWKGGRRHLLFMDHPLFDFR
jgi:hypothetical protein